MSAAEDTVHYKAMLADDFDSPMFRTMFEGWMDAEKARFWPGAATFKNEGDVTAEMAYMRRVLESSENFYVSPPMMRLANEVAPDMPDEELLPHDLPAMSGFMWYGEPYRQIDIRRKVLSDNCIMWDAHGGKVRVWHFTHKSNPEDWVNQWIRANYDEEQIRQLPMLSINHVFEMHFDKVLPRGISYDTPLPWDAHVDWQRTDNDDGTFNMTMVTDQPIDAMFDGGGEPKEIRSPLAAFIVCLWRLCQQSIASRFDEEPNRRMRRRLGRANMPTKPISVITLRRFTQTPAHPEAGVEWQHHWWVRKHWRHQPYVEKQEDGTKKTIYRWIIIHPYIKGDPDKPLLHRDKVNALTR